MVLPNDRLKNRKVKKKSVAKAICYRNFVLSFCLPSHVFFGNKLVCFEGKAAPFLRAYVVRCVNRSIRGDIKFYKPERQVRGPSLQAPHYNMPELQIFHIFVRLFDCIAYPCVRPDWLVQPSNQPPQKSFSFIPNGFDLKLALF